MANPTPADEQSHLRRYKWIYVASFIAVMVFLFYFPSRDKAVSRTMVALAHPSAGSTLLATLKSNTVESPSDDETLTLEASRDTTTRLESMKVCVDAPGFSVHPDPSCASLDVFDKQGTVTDRPSAIFHLSPVHSTGVYKVLITASWVRYVPKPFDTATGAHAAKPKPIDCNKTADACYAVYEKMLLPVGPVEITIDRWERFAGRFSRFLKDLTLPIILVLIGNWLTSASSEQDKKRAAAARKQDEQNQIAQILLPKVMALSGRYYLPMTWHADRVVKISARHTQNANEITFSLLSFLLVARELKEKEGGIFFKNLNAERLFAGGNRILRGTVLAAVGSEAALTALLDSLAGWTWESRWPRLAEQPVVKGQSWAKLEKWVVDLSDDNLKVLRYVCNALAGVLRYESNAPYANWYDELKPFKLEAELDTPKIDSFGDFKDTAAGFIQLLKEYGDANAAPKQNAT